MSWKCCPNCQCPCKNNDLCPNTPETAMRLERERRTRRRIPTSESGRPWSKGMQANMSQYSRDSDFQYTQLEQELLNLRTRLQAAELRCAETERRLNDVLDRQLVPAQAVQRIKDEIISFVQDRFNNLFQLC